MNSKVLIIVLVIMSLSLIKIDAQSLSRCVQACNYARAGLANSRLQAFCRAIPHPATRAACWSAQFASRVNCNGFCFRFFA